MKIQRLVGEQILLKPLAVDGYVMNGHLVPDTVASAIPPQQGVVLKIGPRVTKVLVGDRVVFGLGVGSPLITEDGDEFLFVKEGDVVCGIH